MRSIVTLFFLVIICVSCRDKEPQKPDSFKRKSPIAIAAITHDETDTYVKIVYGQPYKRGRLIFGGLVPFNEVWRTGANEATEITTTKDLLFNGEKVLAGTYALFTIPHKDSWTIILNSDLGQWGDFEYQQRYDVLRTRVTSLTAEQPAEAFTIQIGETTDKGASIIMHWDTTKVKIPITFLGTESDTTFTQKGQQSIKEPK